MEASRAITTTTAAKDSYLEIMKKIYATRYSNIRRTGLIICRRCKKQSDTPMLHIKHINTNHPNLTKYCPFCLKVQTTTALGRVIKKTIHHMKVCCFLHKVENSQYRRLFNTTKKDALTVDENVINSAAIVIKCPLLTIHRFVTANSYLLNVIDYEIKHMNYFKGNDERHQPINAIHMEEIRILYEFHVNFCLRENYHPDWFTIDYSEIECPNDKLIAYNRLSYHDSENIDCMLIRVLSLHWHKYKIYNYTIRYDVFVENIHMFQTNVKTNYFVIAPYMRLIQTIEGVLMINMIIITCGCKHSNCLMISSAAIQAYTIENLDNFIDLCYDLSNNDDEQLQFPNNETYQLVGGLDYGKDVLNLSSKRQPITMHTMMTHTPTKAKLNGVVIHIFSPLRIYAKVYMYALTKYGCIRAFDRLLHRSNLANHITDVIFDSKVFFINYTSMKKDKTTQHFTINLPRGQSFMDITTYRKWNDTFNVESLLGKRIFFINMDNIKLVDDTATTLSIDNNNIYFPHCLFGMNLRYILTMSQVTTYKVVQYHREKLQLEMNNIPQFNY